MDPTKLKRVNSDTQELKRCKKCRRLTVFRMIGIYTFDSTVGPFPTPVYECQDCKSIGHVYWGEIGPSVRSGMSTEDITEAPGL